MGPKVRTFFGQSSCSNTNSLSCLFSPPGMCSVFDIPHQNSPQIVNYINYSIPNLLTFRTSPILTCGGGGIFRLFSSHASPCVNHLTCPLPPWRVSRAFTTSFRKIHGICRETRASPPATWAHCFATPATVLASGLPYLLFLVSLGAGIDSSESKSHKVKRVIKAYSLSLTLVSCLPAFRSLGSRSHHKPQGFAMI